MSILKQALRRKLSVLVLLSAAACAGAPVQEMSDARQAIYAARQVVSQGAPSEQRVQQAETLLEEAQSLLRAGDYSAARLRAEQAKRLAIEAREAVIGDGSVN